MGLTSSLSPVPFLQCIMRKLLRFIVPGGCLGDALKALLCGVLAIVILVVALVGFMVDLGVVRVTGAGAGASVRGITLSRDHGYPRP